MKIRVGVKELNGSRNSQRRSRDPVGAIAALPRSRRDNARRGRFRPHSPRQLILQRALDPRQPVPRPCGSPATPAHSVPPSARRRPRPPPMGRSAGSPGVDERHAQHPRYPRRWIGYLSYDLGRLFEHLPTSATDDLHSPSSHSRCTTALPKRRRTCFIPRAPASHATIRSNFTRPAYEAAVARCIDYIAAGDVFQVNLSQRFSVGMRTTPPRDLRTASSNSTPRLVRRTPPIRRSRPDLQFPRDYSSASCPSPTAAAPSSPAPSKARARACPAWKTPCAIRSRTRPSST